MVVADGANDEPGAGAEEHIGHGGDQGEGKIDDDILAEQDSADMRDVGQEGNWSARAWCPAARQRFPDQAGKPEAEKGEREAGRHLVGDEGQGEEAEEQRHQHSGKDRSEETEKRPAGDEGRAEAAHRAHDHHAFDAEIEHAGTLDDELADRREQERGGGGDDGER